MSWPSVATIRPNSRPAWKVQVAMARKKAATSARITSRSGRERKAPLMPPASARPPIAYMKTPTPFIFLARSAISWFCSAVNS